MPPLPAPPQERAQQTKSPLFIQPRLTENCHFQNPLSPHRRRKESNKQTPLSPYNQGERAGVRGSKRNHIWCLTPNYRQFTFASRRNTNHYPYDAFFAPKQPLDYPVSI
jgi:hypothetical protein